MVRATGWGHVGYGRGAQWERAGDEVWKGQFARADRHNGPWFRRRVGSSLQNRWKVTPRAG